MGKIKDVYAQTENPYLNLYELKAVNKKGGEFSYYLASRGKKPENLKLNTRKNSPDGVVIFGVKKGKTKQEDRIVLVRQYRYTIDDYIYELPAGLVEEGEDFHQAAVREMREETGLILHPLKTDSGYERPFFTTIGMTDESCAAVYGYVEGETSGQFQEDSEEIEVILADRREAARILREENAAIMCAYHLMHFLRDEDVFAFLNLS
ncbi:MAG: NUDIX hydrolase [Ruminococcus sp.]|jgi:ADP-ribose pyrophosphatase